MNLELNPDEKLKQWSNGDADNDELLVREDVVWARWARKTNEY